MQEIIRRIWNKEKTSLIQIEGHHLVGIYLEMKWAIDGDHINIFLTTEEALEFIEALKSYLPKDV